MLVRAAATTACRGGAWRALPCVDARRARNAMRCDAAAPKKRKKTYSFDLLEEYTRKTDGRRRPMPQQIWKGPEIKIHDAWETARPFYATTNLLAAHRVAAPPSATAKSRATWGRRPLGLGLGMPLDDDDQLRLRHPCRSATFPASGARADASARANGVPEVPPSWAVHRHTPVDGLRGAWAPVCGDQISAPPRHRRDAVSVGVCNLVHLLIFTQVGTRAQSTAMRLWASTAGSLYQALIPRSSF